MIDNLTHLTEREFKEKVISIIINNLLKDDKFLTQYYKVIKKEKNPNQKS